MTNPEEEIQGQAEANQTVDPRELYSEIKTCKHSIDTDIASLATHVQEQALSLISKFENFLSFRTSFARIKTALEDQVSGDEGQQWENTLKALIEVWKEHESPKDKIRVVVQPTEDNQAIAIQFFEYQLNGINIDFEIKNSKVAEDIIEFGISDQDDFSAFPTVKRDLPIEDKLLVTEAMLNAIQSLVFQANE